MRENLPTDPEGSLVRAILAHAEMRGGQPVLTCEDECLSWGDFATRVLALAGAIGAVQAEADRPVALIGANSIELVIAYFATIAAGRCVVPLPASATSETLEGMIADCDPPLVFADRNGYELIGATEAQRMVALDFEAEGILGRADFADGAQPLPGPVAASGSADFNIIYSSGTTARPKGIVQSHAMRYRQAARNGFALGPESTTLLATPLYSNTTLMPLLATLFHGGQVVLMRKFEASAFLDLAETHRATHTMLVPVQYQRLLAEPSFDSRNLSAFVVKQCTGAPLSPALKHEIVQRWPGRLFEVFGLTEGGCTCILDAGATPHKAHTVGRPAPGNDVRIIDDEGRWLPAGQAGEVVGRSLTMMSRYFGNAAATEAFYWRDGESNVFHRTGDIGMFDEDGFLVLLDRKKDVIISGGFNIYASDLEHTLLAHPDVEDAAVIAVPSATWGETPLGLVVLRAGAEVSADWLLQWANTRVSKMQRLSAVELRPSLPRSPAGKLLKHEIRKPYWEAKNA